MTVRIGINGFGRMGRAFVRIAAGSDDVEVVGVNDLGSPDALAGLLRRDTVYGRYPGTVEVHGSALRVDGACVQLFDEPDIDRLPWSGLGVDVVVEATGKFTTREQAARHLGAGAPRVVVSAPCKGADATVVLGVDDGRLGPGDLVVSNASCTTNCLAVLTKVLVDAFGVVDGLMTTVHAYTGDQRLVDTLHKDPRRARAAACNIVPTTTGAARSTGEVLAHIGGHLDGLALRVPVPTGSLTDLVALLPEAADREAIDAAYVAAASVPPLAGRLEYSDEDLVSSDIVGASASCIYDSKLTMVKGHLVKVLGWYDNEWGYACRLVELAAKVGAFPRLAPHEGRPE
jgi:glyceraldehyde 3-phosphate dehydrogenase